MPARFLTALLTLFPGSVFAQNAYPQNLFRNPLNIDIKLAGNFGECRPAHFHSGIDIKTDGKENLPVHAAAAGYVSRISMKPGGFGHCLYVMHPEGYTTVYAHLNDFVKPLQDFVRAAQYKAENWEMDTALPPSFFPVAKGQQIAFSGNTGSSTAPHLHFEIRSVKTEHPLNPQLFGLSPADGRAPVLRSVYLYNLDGSFYQTAPLKIPLRKVGEIYRPVSGDTLSIAASRVGIGIDGDDYADGSENTLAPLQTTLMADGETVSTITLDDIGYDATRYVNAYADYSTKQKGGPWVQLLFRLPGNALRTIYDAKQDGILTLGATLVKVEGHWKDAAGRESRAVFWVKNAVGTKSLCKPVWKAGKDFEYESANLRLRGGTAALYDGLCETVRQTSVPGALSPAFQIGRLDVPLHVPVTFLLKPDKPVPFRLRSKLALLRKDEKGITGTPAVADTEGWYRGMAKAFGTFWLEADMVAPVIMPLLTEKDRIRFKITDKTTSVASVRGEGGGKWILLEQHGEEWTYVFDERLAKGIHTLRITARDAVGNVGIYEGKITK